MPLSFIPFTKEHFPEYQSWFSDELLNRELGPMEINDVWLKETIHSTDSKTFAVFENSILVGVIGILLPSANHPEYHITEFAVHPIKRNTGIGSLMLHELLKLHPNSQWKLFVNNRNTSAKHFFEKHGFTCTSKKPDKDNMWEMERRL